MNQNQILLVTSILRRAIHMLNALNSAHGSEEVNQLVEDLKECIKELKS